MQYCISFPYIAMYCTIHGVGDLSWLRLWKLSFHCRNDVICYILYRVCKSSSLVKDFWIPNGCQNLIAPQFADEFCGAHTVILIQFIKYVVPNYIRDESLPACTERNGGFRSQGIRFEWKSHSRFQEPRKRLVSCMSWFHDSWKLISYIYFGIYNW